MVLLAKGDASSDARRERPIMIIQSPTSQSFTTAQPPRALGSLMLTSKRRGAMTVIDQFRHQGSLKALFPKVRGAALDAVFLNTSGGLTGGDRMSITATAGAGAHLRLSSQAAERAYRATGSTMAHVDVTLWAEAGARIDWVPQETILFEGAGLRRKLTVDLAVDARALLVEPLVFGRTEMGEVVRNLAFSDRWHISRAGQLVFADAIRLVGSEIDAVLSSSAITGGMLSVTTILLAAPDAAAHAAHLQLSGQSGVSVLSDDLALVRLIAKDGFDMRRQMVPVIGALSGAPIPRVWRL